VLKHCWEAEEARRFVRMAKELGPQPSAFYTPALDSGARKGELCGLQWKDIEL
jgi:integrase